MIDLVFKNHTSQKSPGESFFKKVLEKGMVILKLNKKLELSVNLVGEAKIKNLNKKYRKKDKSTDVLSFPLGDGNGDIFICLSIAKKEAKRENISIQAKLAQLTVHGFLHLLGYGHPDDSVGTPTLRRRGETMFKLEETILNKLD